MMLEIRGLSVGYGTRTVLHGIDLHGERGELLALIGPNGCGKTTLLRAMSGVLAYDDGSIALDGDEVREISPAALARRIAVVAQGAPLPERFTAFELALMGRTPHLRLLQSESRRDVETVRAAMLRTDCWQLRDRYVEELSGGERQRVVIARALAQEPQLLLLDEPTSHLDIQHQVTTFRLMLELCREDRIGVIAVVHDLTLASMFAVRIALISDGRIAADGAPGDVMQAPLLERVYGMGLRIFAHPVNGRPIVVPEPEAKEIRREEAAEALP